MAGMNVLAHGVDLVQIARIAALLDTHGERFLARCFTDGERAYAESGRRTRVERYAARFACKEAVMKALGTGWRDGISWRDIEIAREPSGQPRLTLTGRCAELAEAMSITAWRISLSHTGTAAIASVIGCDA